jgi:predicted type IV restriction endonuclease
MQALRLPVAKLHLKSINGKTMVFDVLRKKYVLNTPEEWVRQHFVHYLMDHLQYAPGLIAVETLVVINGLRQRADVVVYNRKGKPMLIVECKAPSVKADRKVFDQAARYNMKLGVKYLVITNGMLHFCARLKSNASYDMLPAIPSFEELQE